VNVRTIHVRLGEKSTEADDIQVRVGMSLHDNGNTNPSCSRISFDEGVLVFKCDSNGRLAQFVNVRLPGQSKVLSICQVRVFGDEVQSSLVDLSSGLHWIGSDSAMEEQSCLRLPGHSSTKWSMNLKDSRRVHIISFTVTGENLMAWPTVKVHSGFSLLANHACVVTETTATPPATLSMRLDCQNRTASLITLEIENPSAQVLNLCNTTVLGPEQVNKPLIDLAVFGQQFASSERSSSNSSCVDTFRSENPWRQVDLRVPSSVDSVVVRLGSHESPSLSVSVLNMFNQWVDCGSPITVTQHSSKITDCGHLVGRFVRITSRGWNQVLSLCDIEVWGRYAE